MCYQVKCGTCGKSTWAGCGRHVASVHQQIPEGQHCACRDWPGVSANAAAGTGEKAGDSGAGTGEKAGDSGAGTGEKAKAGDSGAGAGTGTGAGERSSSICTVL